MQTTAKSSDYVNTIPIEVYIDPAQINWALLIQDMKEAGLSGTSQALSIDCQWSTLQRWWQGSEPSFQRGYSLLILHAKTCGITATHQRLRESVK